MTNLKAVFASQLQKGDTIFLETGEPVVLKNVSNGMYHNSRLLTWGGGEKDWACVANSAKVEIRQ